MTVNKIKAREDGIVLYGIVPPKKEAGVEQIKEIASRQIGRLRDFPIDGLIVYDLQDEKPRTAEDRPFPFIETVDPLVYSREYLAALSVPKIIYRSVGKYSRREMSQFLAEMSPDKDLTVFVGTSSASQAVTMSLGEAYRLKRETGGDLLLGGVTIPERHLATGDEHLRVFGKISQGCSFFVTQGVYDVNASKSFLSDYYYYGRDQNIPLVPIIFTFTPCGSFKTLHFMKWLGISVPRWLENELTHSPDILEQSIEFSMRNWTELRQFARQKGIPVGCNIESVAVRKAEVEASLELLRRVVEEK